MRAPPVRRTGTGESPWNYSGAIVTLGGFPQGLEIVALQALLEACPAELVHDPGYDPALLHARVDGRDKLPTTRTA